jgi:fibronectin type 3 domain-containing protein
MKSTRSHFPLGAWVFGVFVLLLGIFAALRGCDARSHSVTLTWRAPAPHAGVTVVGYNVYRRTEGASFVRIAAQVPGLVYEDTLVTRGRVYLYVVTSVDQRDRESRFSEEVRAEIP